MRFIASIEGVEKSNHVIMLDKISLHAQHVPVRMAMIRKDLLSGAKRCLIGTRKMVNYAWAN